MNNTLAYVTNTKTKQTTRYNNYDFDHVVKFHGKHYGVKVDGLYLLEGNSDDGVQIESSFRINKNDFGVSQLKRVPYLYVDSDDDTDVTPHIDGTDSGFIYLAAFDGKRTKLGRGLKGRYWSFEFSSIGGIGFRVRGVEIEPEVMTRKYS